MKSLTITLCLLIKATVIIAKTVRLPPVVNQLKFYAKTYKPIMVYTTPIPWHYTPRPNKFLYNYNYNTDTGIQAQEHGHLNNVGTNQEAMEARGSYTDNEGNTFQVSYIANENGFQPEGAHLSIVPPLIRKALQYIAEHPEESENE
ncbi:endocuticle structural glycoprotein SgAbd-3-like [Cataglyphis hispanica]|uniref:endocuticle structural glycoprotein SgAbd-3-like n=1 Tax=Cataglyphis hispanica TaxID=1086592 RepID=UPI0021800156|nr:endocuticle structural glycoprotein SgAbd-3-like [Cataglyphis hispanica]